MSQTVLTQEGDAAGGQLLQSRRVRQYPLPWGRNYISTEYFSFKHDHADLDV